MKMIDHHHNLTHKPSDYNVTSTLDNDKDNPNTSYYCKYCSTKLHYQSTDEQTGKRIFGCSKCNISSCIPGDDPDIRRSARFKHPKGADRELLTANINEDIKASGTPYYTKTKKEIPSPYSF